MITCPICQFSSKNFNWVGRDFDILKKYDVIGAGRRQVLCPRCGSIDRDRLIYIFLREVFNIENKNNIINVLHIAPEKSLLNIFLSLPNINYIIGDIDTTKYKSFINIRKIDITQTNFDDNYFDLVICNHVLEHITDDSKAMQEIFRILNLKRHAILQVPISNCFKTIEDKSIIDPLLREQYFGQHDHVRIYGTDYIEKLKDIGFKVLPTILDKKYYNFGIDMREKIFLCEK
jgi:SAM-dependent methyltransferase